MRVEIYWFSSSNIHFSHHHFRNNILICAYVGRKSFNGRDVLPHPRRQRTQGNGDIIESTLHTSAVGSPTPPTHQPSPGSLYCRAIRAFNLHFSIFRVVTKANTELGLAWLWGKVYSAPHPPPPLRNGKLLDRALFQPRLVQESHLHTSRWCRVHFHCFVGIKKWVHTL